MKRNELKMYIAHDVLVSSSKYTSKRKRDGMERKHWRRVISALDVSAHFLSSLCGFSGDRSVLELLCCHQNAVKVIYNVALIIRQVIENVNELEGSSPCRGSSSVAVDKNVLKAIYAEMTPSSTSMQRGMRLATSAIPIDVYQKENIVIPGEKKRRVSSHPDDNGEARISNSDGCEVNHEGVSHDQSYERIGNGSD